MPTLEPVYTEEGILIYHGDSAEITKQLAIEWEEKIDCIISDPPYGISYQSNYRIKKELLGEKISNDEDLTIVDAIYPNLVKMLKQDTAAYFFAHPNMIGENRLILDRDLKYKNTIVWDKGEGGTFGDLEAGYSLNWEAILYYNKGRRKLQVSRPRCIARDMKQYPERHLEDIPKEELLEAMEILIKNLPNDNRDAILAKIPQDVISKALMWHPNDIKKLEWSARHDQVHPTSKPVMLIEWMIRNSTNEGDVILDPFLGSGTTAAACKRLNRGCIGIELRGEFIDRTIDRLRNVKKKTGNKGD